MGLKGGSMGKRGNGWGGWYGDAGGGKAVRGRGRGQGNFKLAANFDYICEGQLTLAKVCVSVGS